MILVTGGLASGEHTFVRGLGYDEAQIADGALDDSPVVLNAQELVRDMSGGKDADLATLVEQLAAKDVVACVEMGSGVVPLDRSERDWRDRAGALACALAARADAVVRMTCGVPVAIKGTCPPEGGATLSRSDSPRFVGSATGASESLRNSLGEGSPAPQAADAGTRLVSTAPSDELQGNASSDDERSEVKPKEARDFGSSRRRVEQSSSVDEAQEGIELVIMRHGATKGNEERRYVGALDHPLSPLGCAQAVAAGIHPEIDRVYVTTLVRSQQTAAICFPCAQQVIVDGLQEMNFGVFAGRSADEMVDDADYRAWVDGNCEGQCPEGESRAQASNRICRALGKLVVNAQKAGEKRVILVAHGGTLMAAFDRHSVDYPDRDYFSWNTGNCQGYVAHALVTKGGTFTLDNCRHFENLDFLGA